MTLSSWWDRFRKSGASATSPRGAETSAQGDGASPDAQDPLGRVRWVPATENPFGVDVLDCSAFAESMVSASSSPEVAKRFMELRASDGEHCRGKDPTIAASARCLLTYPSSAHAQSALFRAAEMEEKWDVFLLDGDLNFARSWTGELVYRASMTFEPSRTIVSEIFGVREPGSRRALRRVHPARRVVRQAVVIHRRRAVGLRAHGRRRVRACLLSAPQRLGDEGPTVASRRSRCQARG